MSAQALTAHVMLRDDNGTYESSPQRAQKAIAEHRDVLLLDLDETLYLRNSTEDFIDSARPGILARLLLKVIDLIKPWRAMGGLPTRDVWRVGLIVVFFPWTVWVWRRRVQFLASQFSNEELIDAVNRSAARPVVVTLGFLPIVRPLLAAMGLARVELVAARWFTVKDRRRGKMDMAVTALGTAAVERALVLTDSVDDMPLLRCCACPHRVTWPNARFVPAHGNVYLPGEYLTKVKHSGSRYILHGILKEDFALWTLSSIAMAARHVPTTWSGLAGAAFFRVAGLFMLLVSFWAVYEHGNVDNDKIAAEYESVPKLSDAYWTARVSTSSMGVWCWALAAGAAGVFVVHSGAAPWSGYAKWLSVLLATNGVFWLYNRLDKSTRIWLYGWLQVARTAAFTVLVPVVPIGAVALGSHALSRWVPYFYYRASASRDWPQTPQATTRLLFFLMLSVVLMTSMGVRFVFNSTGAALLVWYGYKARRELKKIVAVAHRLERGRDAQPGKCD